jgi:hypothetical protein
VPRGGGEGGARGVSKRVLLSADKVVTSVGLSEGVVNEGRPVVDVEGGDDGAPLALLLGIAASATDSTGSADTIAGPRGGCTCGTATPSVMDRE